MSTFVPFNSPCDVVDTLIYENRQFPTYRTVEVVGVRNLKVDSINFKNDKGQIINLARATGTNKENVKLLLDSLTNQGYDTSKIPPIVEKSDNCLYDGFSRQESLIIKNHDVAPYLVVKRKSGYTIEDVIDEIGLGANNHSQSKKANIVDFKKRLQRYVMLRDENNIETTTNDAIKWFGGIPHAFNDKQIEDAIDDVFNSKRASVNMEAFTKKQAQEKGAELLNKSKKSVIAINKTNKGSSSTYMSRAILEILEYYDEYGENPSVIAFLQNVPAEEAESFRKKLREEAERVNRLFARVADNYRRGKKYDFIKLEGFIPQIIDEETDLVD